MTVKKSFNSAHSSFVDNTIDIYDINFKKEYMIQYGATEDDFLIQDPTTRVSQLSKTKDPLFVLFKNPLNIDDIFRNNNEVHIAMSDDGNFEFYAIRSAARKIMQQHEHIKIHLLSYEIAQREGINLLSKFDGFINPGGKDSFSKEFNEFNNDQCPHLLEVEKIYQFIVKKALELKMPYLGICSGLQHLALIHDSFLKPVQGYQNAKHLVEYIPGTISHFQILNFSQQESMLERCEYNEAAFEVLTYNNYAAISSKLGKQIGLGATCKSGHVMALEHSNGIQYGVQYHPEHSYVLEDENSLHPTIQFANFVNIATMHHSHRIHNKTHPIEYFAQIKIRLQECINAPTCLIDSNYQIDNGQYIQD